MTRHDREIQMPTSKDEIVVSHTICPRCTEIIGAATVRIPDPKGKHKCQRCRTELTEKYKRDLPGIKEDIKRSREMPR